MPMPFGFRNYLSILIANAVTHFDNALYGYLVPIIAPMCFPGQTVINQLILGYSMLMLAFLAKPLGVVVFSKMVARKKEIFVLRYTLFGIGLGLLVIGIFPVQNTWYNYGLCFARWCIEACSAGEYAIAKLYILNSVDNKMAKQCSVWYEVSTMLGIILAGSIGTAFACRPSLSCYWQLPFILASLITWGNFFFLRRCVDYKHDLPLLGCESQSIFHQLLKERNAIVRIAIVSGFSYVTYVISFVWLNSFMPLVSTISYKTMMQYNMLLLWSDLVLLVGVGLLCKNYDHNNLMAVASGLVACFIIPFFCKLPGASIMYVICMRYGLLFCGVIFCCFLTFWAKQQLIQPDNAYLVVGFSCVLGSSLLGKSSTTICFYLYHCFASPIAPACYIAVLAFIAMLIMADSVCYD